jgi:hypothetical protein
MDPKEFVSAIIDIIIATLQSMLESSTGANQQVQMDTSNDWTVFFSTFMRQINTGRKEEGIRTIHIGHGYADRNDDYSRGRFHIFIYLNE